MSEPFVPQRWVEPTAPVPQFDPRDDGAPAGQESVLAILVNFIGLVRRNWQIVLAETVAALLVAALLIHLDQPLYRAMATIRYEDKSRALSGGLGGGAAEQLGGPATDPLLTQIQVLQSRAVATEVVNREGLRVTIDPARIADGLVQDVQVPDEGTNEKLEATFGSGTYSISDGRAVATATYGSPVKLGGVQLTVGRRPDVDKAVLQVAPLDRAVDNFISALRGRPRERTDIIDVTYESPNPGVAKLVANAAVMVFQDHNATSAKQESVRRRKFIEDQLRKTETLLSEAEASHNQFRSRERVYSSQDKLKSQQADLTGIELRRQELTADRDMYVGLLQALQDPRRTTSMSERMNALVSSPGMASNALVAGLYAQLAKLQATRDSLTTGPYGASANNPDVARINGLIAGTSSQIVSAVRGQIAAADARLAALTELQQRSAGTMSVLPTTEAEEAGLLAQVDGYRKEADRLREELQKAQIDEAAQAGQIDIVDLATRPKIPIGTGKKPRVVLATILGIAIGALIAYILENYSSVIRRREDVERATTATILTVVPPFTNVANRGVKLQARTKGDNGSGPVASEHSDELVTVSDLRSHAAESYRTLRTNLLFSTELRSLRLLLVTSSGPSEGKSTTSANLAAAFAQQGKRVLLIDCDLRRPRLHKMFGHAQIPGLTNVLVGGASHAEVIAPSGIDNLSVMSAGPIPPNPVELLGSDAMGALLHRLAESYDLLLLDTPPVLVASDAAILSRHVDGTLYVVRAGQTQTAALRDGIQRLGTVGTQVLGIVVNDPDGQVAKFSSYYGYAYNQYYEASPA